MPRSTSVAAVAAAERSTAMRREARDWESWTKVRRGTAERMMRVRAQEWEKARMICMLLGMKRAMVRVYVVCFSVSR